MSNITSLDELWGKTWQFNETLYAGLGTSGYYCLTISGEFTDPIGTISGEKSIYSCPSQNILRFYYYQTNFNNISVNLSYSDYTSDHLYIWKRTETPEWQISDRTISFIEKPSGISFTSYPESNIEELISWWNSNTTLVTDEPTGTTVRVNGKVLNQVNGKKVRAMHYGEKSWEL